MSRTLLAICFAILCAVSAGCGDKAYKGDQRFAVSGKVTVDGQPLEPGMIAFYPKDAGKDGKGRVTGVPVRDGSYTIPEENGPTAGTYRIEIHWNKPTGKKVKNPFEENQMIDELMEGLPAKYHQDSELTAEVNDKQTTFDFDLKTE